MANESVPVDAKVAAILAKGDADNIESYLARGRRWKETDISGLGKIYVETFKAMLKDIKNSDRRRDQSDVGAEFALRGGRSPVIAAQGPQKDGQNRYGLVCGA